MSRELICSWLGLDPEQWPPDHYRLLGLEPGETDTALIEQRVHERLDAVRCYQMLHPEPATEAMNRLAQAFVCLTEPAAKKLYDASLPAARAVAAAPALSSPAPTSAAEADTVIETRDPLSWLNAPAVPPSLPAAVPPVPPPLPGADRQTGTSAAAVGRDAPPTGPAGGDASVVTAAGPGTPVVTHSLEPVDSVVAEAQSSREARRGLGTKRALYHRIARTRGLLRAWDEAGRYLATPRRRPLRRAEILDLLARIDHARELLRGFPPLLGQAGQPGYHVLLLDQVDPTQLPKLITSQRENLGRDWEAARKLLLSHRDFLRQETRARRRRTVRQRLVHACRTFLADYPAAVVFLIGLLALDVSILKVAILDGNVPPKYGVLACVFYAAQSLLLVALLLWRSLSARRPGR